MGNSLNTQKPFSRFVSKPVATGLILPPLMVGDASPRREKLRFKALFGSGGGNKPHTQEMGLCRTSTLQYLTSIEELEVYRLLVRETPIKYSQGTDLRSLPPSLMAATVSQDGYKNKSLE